VSAKALDPRAAAEAAAAVSAANGTRLLTAEQLAERWQLPKSQVYRLARDGRLRCVKLGRYRRFAVAVVEEFERAGGCDADE
jgi:excisionase family DNA binding protein